MTMDIAPTLTPKSTQLNADDLLAGPITITVRGVSPGTPEQPVVVRFEGDDGRPFLPCKTMRRLLAHAWGTDGHAWIGRSMTLYHDPSVVFGGIKVGGIRISHLSHIDHDLEVALTVTKGKKALYRVRPLAARKSASSPATAERVSAGVAPPEDATADLPLSAEPAAGGAQPALLIGPAMSEDGISGKARQRILDIWNDLSACLTPDDAVAFCGGKEWLAAIKWLDENGHARTRAVLIARGNEIMRGGTA